MNRVQFDSKAFQARNVTCEMKSEHSGRNLSENAERTEIWNEMKIVSFFELVWNVLAIPNEMERNWQPCRKPSKKLTRGCSLYINFVHCMADMLSYHFFDNDLILTFQHNLCGFSPTHRLAQMIDLGFFNLDYNYFFINYKFWRNL